MINRHAVCYVGGNLDELAEREAQKLLCGQAEPCNVCNSCIKVQNKSHPDLIWVREYKVKEVREAVATANVLPNDGGLKVYIFPEADSMRAECQNALLKFTEEPPDYVRIIFTAKSPDLLLDTIKSRLFFVNADSGSAAPSGELKSIAEYFTAALIERNEHAAATALTRIKTRDDLSNIMPLISSAMHDSQSKVRNYVEVQKFLLDCTDDLKYNPYIALFCAHITAEIFEKLK
jgi:DNA polymerase III delta prime subunit